MQNSALRVRIRRLILIFADFCLIPFILAAALPFRLFRRVGAQRLPLSRQLFRRFGVWPLFRHYYEPLIDPADLSTPLQSKRTLPGITWNVDEQLTILSKMSYGHELREFLQPKQRGELRYSYQNESFLSGDADYLYSWVRLFKPRRIIEIGCGNSTLLIASAVSRNRQENEEYTCSHICVEPYEQPWLEQLNVQVIRQRVERMGLEPFLSLQPEDLLFIDSSHVIRPCGDVVFQILEVLPRLSSGVFVHVHDIFSPNNYLANWVVERGLQWNEQYLLEAFLSQNSHYKIIGALNYLHHQHYVALESICATHTRDREPGSFYIQRL